MRTTAILALASLAFASTAASAEPCVYGHNRPAIDAVDRHLAPGATVVHCDMQTMKLVTPSGKVRDEKIWVFRSNK